MVGNCMKRVVDREHVSKIVPVKISTQIKINHNHMIQQLAYQLTSVVVPGKGCHMNLIMWVVIIQCNTRGTCLVMSKKVVNDDDEIDEVAHLLAVYDRLFCF